MARGERGSRGIDARDSASGFVVFRASRMDALLDPLMQMLAATRPESALAPQTIIAAHPGLTQWLAAALAQRQARRGIVANLDVLLPSAWIERQAQAQLGRRAVSLPNYGQKRLRWTIHAILADDPQRHGIDVTRLGAFLRGEAGSLERRRFQLADRLARIYSQYLVYRPNWLHAWENSRFVTTRQGADAIEAGLLAPLWREVRHGLGAHRGEIVEELLAALGEGALLAERSAVHVFGVSHLAPSELGVLRAAAATRVVALYLPDPCREYWGGISADRAMLHAERVAEAARIEQAGTGDFWVERAHPLLARWGRLGQHFVLALADAGADEDIRHWRDDIPAEPTSRLDRVQQSIRVADGSMIEVDLRDAITRRREFADSSLRIHSCHTRLRELEVLRDNLIDAMDAAATRGEMLKPAEIVVMAPDIHAYVPLIPAVFGAAGSARGLLPYHLADVAVSNSHRLLNTFRRLLDIPASRVTAPEVADLLAVPEVARRLDIEGEGVEKLTAWLRQSRVAWALDGAHRRRFEVPAIEEYTFGWAMDRMLAGYLMADASIADGEENIELADGCELAPLPGIEAPAAAGLGALDHLLREIEAFCALARSPRRASEWSAELERLYVSLFRIDVNDREAREAHAAVLRFIREIAAEPAEAGVDPVLQFTIVRDLLVERLSAVPERQRFLMGGVTFCGMVPRRAIPFKLIAVLGLNDGEFPRADSDAGLDLMARHRRLGDRDVRTDDRYLFLETVMAARERLHLSYIGEGVRDGKPRNPAIPLAELLDALGADPLADEPEEIVDGAPRKAPRGPPWLIRHPLQPFDARYFDTGRDRDARLFSYSDAYARMQAGDGEARLAAFYDRSDSLPVDVDRVATLTELREYFREPSRQVLRNRMKLRLDALADDRLREDEPLAAKLEAIDRVAQRLFFDEALRSPSWPPVNPPAWLRLGGLLPPGTPGRIAWECERDKATRLLAALRSIADFPVEIPALREETIEQRIGEWRVAGTVAHVLAMSGRDGREIRHVVVAPSLKGGELKSEAELTFKDRVPAFLDWALLRLQSAHDAMPPGIRLALLTDAKKTSWHGAINAWDERFLDQPDARRGELCEALRARVLRLLEIWRAAQSRPPVYFPKTSWGVQALADAKDASAAAGKTWFGADRSKGERDYEPGYNVLLAGDWTFAADDAETGELMRFAHELRALISLDQAQGQAS